VLVNVGRGSLIDFEALTTALENGTLAGVAMDVFPVEPPGQMRLFEMDNVLCTPHLGAQTVQAHEAVGAGVIEHLRELLPVPA
jgi:D-3-phosphoglycerate dehydrogenase / 2-oxoglutarate reductase